MTSTLARRTAAGALLVGLLLGSAGCGSGDGAPLDQVPALSARLDSIDTALADGRYRAARDRLGDLVEETVAARDRGELDEAGAQRILAAAARLLSALPTVAAPVPTVTPTTAAPTPREPRTKPEGDKPGKGRGDDKGDKGDRDDKDDKDDRDDD